MLKMDLEYSKGILFVRLEGSLTYSTVYKINNYLIPVLLKHRIKYLVYNFYKLETIDEKGVSALNNTRLAINNNKGSIYVCEVNKKLNKMIKKSHIKNCGNELEAFKLIEV